MADKANTSPAGARTVSAVDSPAAIRNVVLVGPSGAAVGRPIGRVGATGAAPSGGGSVLECGQDRRSPG